MRRPLLFLVAAACLAASISCGPPQVRSDELRQAAEQISREETALVQSHDFEHSD